MQTFRPRPAPAARPGQLTRDDWNSAARAVLVSRGLGAQGVRALAAELSVRTGAFYWQFRGLEALHDAPRVDWADRNTAPLTRALCAAGPHGLRQYLAWVRVVAMQDEFDPGYDNAIRDCAHHTPQTAMVLAQVEHFRIAWLRRRFDALGFVGHASEIRARVACSHQVGYSVMRVREPHDQRLRNVPYCAEILADSRALAGLDSTDAIFPVLNGGPIDDCKMQSLLWGE